MSPPLGARWSVLHRNQVGCHHLGTVGEGDDEEGIALVVGDFTAVGAGRGVESWA